VVLAALGVAGPACATAAAPPAKQAPTWDLKLGLSYLATTGNADTSSSGVDASYNKVWKLWSLETTAAAVRATRNDIETAESTNAQLRSRRKISEHLQMTAGLRGETNRFAGLDLRTILDSSLSWSVRDTPAWRLRTLWGLSWTTEDPRGDRPRRSSVGGLVQLQSMVRISEGSELNSQVTAWPDLESSEDYRINANAALQAALNRHLALRLGYDVKYDNEPIRGFQRTDTTSTASLVVQLGRAARR
jgi:putative salt-induced outer membrane protein